MPENKSKLIIGVPVHNDFKYLNMMIDSLWRSTSAFDQIVFIESESTDGSKEYCDMMAKTDNRVRVIHTNKEGPLKAYNKLFQIALDEEADLFLTQTDVIFPRLLNRDWLNEMKVIAQHPDIGAVTCTNGGGVSGPSALEGFRWLGGWCSYYPFKTIQAVGGYDENFPNGYAVDIDHTYKIFKAGLKIFYLDYWVDHHQMNSREHDNNPESEKMKKEANEFFKKKWGLK